MCGDYVRPKTRAGASVEIGIEKFDMNDMGRFMDNSATMSVKAFDNADPCLLEMQVGTYGNAYNFGMGSN